MRLIAKPTRELPNMEITLPMVMIVKSLVHSVFVGCGFVVVAMFVVSVIFPPVNTLFALENIFVKQKNPLEVYYLKGMLFRICDNSY